MQSRGIRVIVILGGIVVLAIACYAMLGIIVQLIRNMHVLEIVLHQQRECHNAQLVLEIHLMPINHIQSVLRVILVRLLFNMVCVENVLRRRLIQICLIQNALLVITEV